MAAVSIPDLPTASALVTGAFDKYSSCIASFGPVAAASSAIGTQAAGAVGLITVTTSSWPSQILGTVMVIAGLALTFCGYMLVRPANFAAGAYLGGTVALLLLTILVPAFSSCPAIVAAATVCGLVVGVLCAMKRSSILAVLGLVAGEIAGDVAYKALLMPLGAPEYAAFFCIGFFAVLLGVLAGNLGDFMVKVLTAFFGSYIALTNALKLVAPMVPAPYGPQLLAFNTFQPQYSLALLGSTVQTAAGSPYIYGPLAALLLLTAAGTSAQVALLKKAREASDMESLIRK